MVLSLNKPLNNLVIVMVVETGLSLPSKANFAYFSNEGISIETSLKLRFGIKPPNLFLLLFKY